MLRLWSWLRLCEYTTTACPMMIDVMGTTITPDMALSTLTKTIVPVKAV